MTTKNGGRNSPSAALARSSIEQALKKTRIKTISTASTCPIPASPYPARARAAHPIITATHASSTAKVCLRRIISHLYRRGTALVAIRAQGMK